MNLLADFEFSAQGNLIHAIGGNNPSRMLVDAIKTSRTPEMRLSSSPSKDEEFFVGVVDAENVVSSYSF